MSETGKHTPGPLQIVEAKTLAGGDQWHVFIADQDGRKIAALWGRQEEKIANANLFIAASDMLAALIEIERLCGCPKPNLAHIKTIAARERAKATGTP